MSNPIIIPVGFTTTQNVCGVAESSNCQDTDLKYFGGAIGEYMCEPCYAWLRNEA